MADITLIFEEQPISLELTTATPINLVLDGGATYTAGTGISIAGAVITNTAPNVVQELSISGQDLTLSGGGGTVAIPVGASDALGTGFTSGGGTGAIPAGTVASIGSTSRIKFGDIGDRVLFQGDGTTVDDFSQFIFAGSGITLESVLGDASNAMVMAGDLTRFTASRAEMEFIASKSAGKISFISDPINFVFSNASNSVKVTDNREPGSQVGIEYNADYSADIINNPTSFTDVTSVNLLKQTPVSYDNASAPNNCIFYSTTLSKLAYKDPGGTVNPLY